jgi:hypothetical protein
MCYKNKKRVFARSLAPVRGFQLWSFVVLTKRKPFALVDTDPITIAAIKRGIEKTKISINESDITSSGPGNADFHAYAKSPQT